LHGGEEPGGENAIGKDGVAAEFAVLEIESLNSALLSDETDFGNSNAGIVR